MMDLALNKQKFYYALYKGVQEQTDAFGNYTGEYSPEYYSPVEFAANISAAKGSAETEPFGIDTPYTKKIVTCDMSCPIAEDTVLWIGITPDNDTPHNYAVARVARSLNSIMYAVAEVSVS